LLECEIRGSRDLVTKKVIVQLEFTVEAEKVAQPIVQEALFKLLDVDIVKLLVDFRVVHVDAVCVQLLQHVLVKRDVLRWVNIDDFFFAGLKVDHHQAQWPCASLQLTHDVSLKDVPVCIKEQVRSDKLRLKVWRHDLVAV
jgi:hypothetical protein